MYQKLSIRKKKLEKLLVKVEEDIKQLPQGRLRISRSRGTGTFYLMQKSKDTVS